MEKTTKRLAPTSETIKKLLLRSGNECAFPNCNEVLFNDNDILIGECCHIEGALPGGERYNPNQSDEERRSYENLLFLCHKHHVESDNEFKYTVDTLKEIKLNHENRFREKPIAIKDDYIKQVFSYFDEILSITKETSNAVKRIEEKQDDILELLKSSEPIKDQTYFDEYFGIPPTILFKGRTREIKELSSFFNEYNTFIIGGISGIGKTSLLGYFLDRIKSHKTLWIDCNIIKTREIFFEYFSRFVKQEFSDQSVKHALSTSDDHSINRSILYSLQKWNCCIVFDSLNSPNHNLITFIKILNEYLKESKVFITTTYNLDTVSWRNTSYKLELLGLEKNDFCKLVESYNIPSLTLDISNRFFKILNGHPYLLKLSTSLLQYQPLDYLIDNLESKGADEIKEYIKEKILEVLKEEEKNLLKELSDFIIPFRYSIESFLNSKNFSKNFKVLRDCFLIEKFHNIFFIIPEFIRINLSIDEINTKKIECHTNYTNYLLSLTENAVIFEENALIYHALEANLIEIAKREAKNFLSTLMANGYFNLAFKTASELEQNPKMADFSLIYYVQGRIFRFRESYQEALEKYNTGLKYSDDSIEINGLIFEKASMLTYLSEKLNDKKLLKEALEIYNDLSKNKDATLAAQSQLSTIIILRKSKEGNEIQEKLENLKNSIDINKVEINVQASIWQLLGSVYSENKNYKNAFIAFEKSISFYKLAINRFGMNIIDGLYNAHESYGWACVKAEDYYNAVEKFKVCVDLCENFDLGLKKESALFDYGYHLIITLQFKKASEILSEYYEFILDNEQIEDNDLPLIFGTLAFAYWYNNSFLEAIESLGVYLIYCSKESIRPIISIMQSDDMSQEIDFIHFFQKRVYILILPTGKTFNDLKNWIAIVTNKRPELLEPLTEFYFFRKEE